MNKVLDMTQVINESFTSYAGAVLQSRALVDVRDCIKPSARQIFYCLYTDKFTSSKPFKKTLKAVGSAMRVYIHGDASAEGVILRASQNFAMRYPLVEVEGNNGNLMESGNWAASRYTSSRLSSLTEKMFSAIDKDTIDDWRDNYDDTEKYPSVLPTKGFYNIVNGTFGIGIGAGSSIPQYNLKEVNHALEVLLLNPDAGFNEIYCVPDFATGAYLLNETKVKEFMKNGGGGSCKLRAKIEYDIKDNCLVVTEIPYGVYTNTICKELESIIESDDNPGIDRFNDLTGEAALIKIYLKKKAQPIEVEKFLYKRTSLQSFYGINFTMLDKGKYPKVFTWKEALQAHIDHEIEVYTREYEYEKAKMAKRIHIIDGLIICLASIDEVVADIKSSNSTKEAKEKLIKNYLVDDEQATAVLAMKLSNLAKLEIEKLKNEKTDLLNKIAEIDKILNNKDLFNAELIKGWREVAEKYGDERRTKIIEDFDEEKEETPEDVFVIVTTDNQIKSVPFDNFNPQTRNTKGSKKDNVISCIPTRTDKMILVFTDNGKYCSLKVKEIKDGYYLNSDDRIIAAFDSTEAEPYLIFFTRNGMVKKTEFEQYKSNRHMKNPVQAIKLKEKDKVVSVTFITEEPVAITTKLGQFVKMTTADIKTSNKITMGYKAMTLKDNDEVISGFTIKNKNDYLIFVSKDGYGKKVIDNFAIHNKGVQGSKIGLNANDYLIAAIAGKDTDNIIINGKPNSICLSVGEFPLISYSSIGNKLIKNSEILSAIKK